MAEKTTAVIVTYQSMSTIDAALTTARAAVDAGELKVVVVDNASADGTGKYVEETYPWVNTRHAGGNLGFGRGCNRGAEDADTPYILFLNPDATLDRDNLKRLVDFMDTHPNAGICGPFLPKQRVGPRFSPTEVVRSSLGLNKFKSRREIQPDEPPFLAPWVCGAALMIRRSLFTQLDGFDPRFFLYFEETDLCFRTLQAGYEAWVVPQAHATHVAGASSSQSSAERVGNSISNHFYQSRFYYMQKHYGSVAAGAAEAVELAVLAARAAATRVGLRDAKPSGLEARLRATVFTPPLPPQP